MKYTVYFVEDDENVNQLIEATLLSGGFNAYGFLDPELFFEVLKDSRPDLIVLDLMLPKISGFDVLKTLKETTAYADIPVIILSALSSERDIVKGLDMGANDYITKPFGLREFISRINANITKIHIPVKRIIKIRDLIVNLDEHKCFYKGKVVDLTNIEFDLLTLLMHSPDVVVTRKKLLKDVWNFEEDCETRTLDMHIKSIRKKLATFTEEVYIETVRGIGFVIKGNTLWEMRLSRKT